MYPFEALEIGRKIASGVSLADRRHIRRLTTKKSNETLINGCYGKQPTSKHKGALGNPKRHRQKAGRYVVKK
jgi:hypothetical protein